MEWLELSLTSPSEFVEPLSQIFHRYGHGGVVVEEDGGFNPDEGEAQPDVKRVTLRTYLPLDSTTSERRNRIDVGVRLVAHVAPVSSLRERVLDEAEWQSSWKQHFHPLRIGKRILVTPTWRDHEAGDGRLKISLDPGMAFGTGHHPTTRMCLELLERLVTPGADVLDLGCGSGILAIASAKLGAGRVLGLEIDSVAVDVARQNVRSNGVGATASIVEGSLPHAAASPRSYDIAVANISAKVIKELAGDLAKAVKPGGAVVVSGILAENKAGVGRALTEAGAALRQTIVDGDWVSLVGAVD